MVRCNSQLVLQTAIFAPDLSRVETGKEPRNCNSIGEALTVRASSGVLTGAVLSRGYFLAPQIGVSILFVFSLPAFGWVVLALRHCDERSVVVYLSVGCSIAHALLVFVPSVRASLPLCLRLGAQSASVLACT